MASTVNSDLGFEVRPKFPRFVTLMLVNASVDSIFVFDDVGKGFDDVNDGIIQRGAAG